MKPISKENRCGKSSHQVSFFERFPNAPVNADEQRRLRASLYKPLLALAQDERARVVDLVVRFLLTEGGE